MGILFHSLAVLVGSLAGTLMGRRFINTHTRFTSNEQLGPDMVRVVAIEVTSKDPKFSLVALKLFPMNWGSHSYFKVAIPTDGSVDIDYVLHEVDKHFRALGYLFSFKEIDCTAGPYLSDGALEDISPSLLVTLGKTEVLRPQQTSKRTIYHWQLVTA